MPLGTESTLRQGLCFALSQLNLASLKSPVAGSPLRLKAMAPALPGFRARASARPTAALALRHSAASPAAISSSEKTNGRAT